MRNRLLLSFDLLIRRRRGHYNRALEDAISANKNQWPAFWAGENPLRGERSFNNMTAVQRVCTLSPVGGNSY